jgi:hypothetical protein
MSNIHMVLGGSQNKKPKCHLTCGKYVGRKYIVVRNCEKYSIVIYHLMGIAVFFFKKKIVNFFDVIK